MCHFATDPVLYENLYELEFLKFILFCVYNYFPTCMSVHTTYMLGAYTIQKRVTLLLELELTVLSCQVGAGKWARTLCRNK